MKKIFLTLALTAGIMASAQVKIGDDVTNLNANSLLELESTSKGVLFPRVTLTGTTDATTVGTQIAGMTVYNTATAGDVTPGMYTSNSTKWIRLGDTEIGLYGKPTRVHPIATSITWLADDVVILLQSTHSGNIVMPSAAANTNRIYGINNRSGSARIFTNQTGGDTGIYANEALSQIGSTATGWFISDGTSWRVYSGRP